MARVSAHVIDGVSGRPAPSKPDQGVHRGGERQAGDACAGGPCARRRLAHAVQHGAEDDVRVLHRLAGARLLQRVADRVVGEHAAVAAEGRDLRRGRADVDAQDDISHGRSPRGRPGPSPFARPTSRPA
jgi:hypothetical protein